MLVCELTLLDFIFGQNNININIFIYVSVSQSRLLDSVVV